MKIAERFDLQKVVELCFKHKDSPEIEIAMLAAGALEMEAAYGQLKNEYTKVVAENVMLRHSKLLEKLSKVSMVENDTTPTFLQGLKSFFKKGAGCDRGPCCKG